MLNGISTRRTNYLIESYRTESKPPHHLPVVSPYPPRMKHRSTCHSTLYHTDLNIYPRLPIRRSESCPSPLHLPNRLRIITNEISVLATPSANSKLAPFLPTLRPAPISLGFRHCTGGLRLYTTSFPPSSPFVAPSKVAARGIPHLDLVFHMPKMTIRGKP